MTFADNLNHSSDNKRLSLTRNPNIPNTKIEVSMFDRAMASDNTNNN